MPIGTTEDRLVGSIDLAAALTGGEVRFAPGPLAAAHGGVLYVDDVNLLPDHLVDVLLDVAVSGVNRGEREGVSHIHASRFVLIGSMNPEEGDLRPQLLDRFGLAADVLAPVDPAERAEAVRRRMVFDADPAAFAGDWPDEPLPANPPAALPDELVHRVSALCASVGAEGLRADLVICRAAAALAGLEGRGTTTVEDVRRVAPLALAHRRRQPFDDPAWRPTRSTMPSSKLPPTLDPRTRSRNPTRRRSGWPAWRLPASPPPALPAAAYQRRDRVAQVTFRGEGAEVALRIEVAKARLTDPPTGGRTPLAAGIHTALALAQHPSDRPLLVLLSNGRATAGPDGQDPLVAAKEAAAEVRRRKVPAWSSTLRTGRPASAWPPNWPRSWAPATSPCPSSAPPRCHLAPSDWS